MVMGRSGFLFEVSEFLEKYKEKTDKRSQFYNPYINEIEGLLTQVSIYIFIKKINKIFNLE